MIIAIIMLSSCTVADQISRMATLALCDFRINTVTGITLAGINVQQIKSIHDLNLNDAQKLLSAITASVLPLNMVVNFDVRNPNATDAGMNRLDWILYIDDIEMTRGSVDQTVFIPRNNGISTIAVPVTIDLKRVLQGKSFDAMLNFGMNLAGTGNRPTRVMAKLKPTIMIGQTALSYPGYINVRTEFGH